MFFRTIFFCIKLPDAAADMFIKHWCVNQKSCGAVRLFVLSQAFIKTDNFFN